jgi:hypothetical protein
MELFRCLTATRLLIDHQLQGTGELPAELQRIAEDATLIAFDQIVDLALDRDVDCLLIAGKSIDPADRSLRGPAALVQGIARLADRDIAVVFHPAESEVWSQWPAGVRFPPNVHRLGAGLETSVSITRQGRLIATVTADQQALAPGDGAGWCIVLAGDAESIRLSGAHGPAQGMRPHETGPHGVVLVDFDGKGPPRHTAMATAPVRWERFAIDVSPDMTRDDLLQEMASQLEGLPRNNCERLWLASWEVSGAGLLIESLARQQESDSLLADLIQLDPIPGIDLACPALRVHNVSPTGWPASGQDDPAVDFVVNVEARLAESAVTARECLAGSEVSGGPWEVRMDSLLGVLDAGELAHDARRMAMHWFAAEEELSS